MVLAGGVGARIGHDEPKQLIELAGRTILEHSIAALHAHPAVTDVLVVMVPGFVERAKEITAPYSKVVDVIAAGAGAPRSDSTVRALAHITALVGDDDALVLLHDAARPLVPQDVITRVVAALSSYDAVDLAVPSPDTIIEIRDDGLLDRELRRSVLRRVQTPQGFKVSLLRAAYEKALADPDFEATDDATVVHRYCPEVPVIVVDGDPRNLKVTEKIDVAIAAALLRDGNQQPRN